MAQIYKTPNFNGLEIKNGVVEQVANSSLAFTNEGRFSFTTDTKKLYVGNGTTADEVGASAVLVDGILDGTIIEKQSVITQDNGTNIYAVVDKDGGGDIKVQFDETIYTIDATGVPDTEGLGNNKARVVLTMGTTGSPSYNYVYIIPNGGNPILQASTNEPTGEFAYVGYILVPDLITYQSEGAMVLQRTNDSIKHEGRGRIPYIDEKLRTLGATYKKGIAYTTNDGAIPIGFSNTSGIVYQLHKQQFPTLDIATDGIYIANHPTTPYLKITDLGDVEARQTTTGDAIINNDRFSYVIWGSISGDGESKLFLNLPNATYSNSVEAYYDVANTAVTGVPEEFTQTAFLIARIPFIYNNTAIYSYINPIGTTETIDLRGSILGGTAGGGAGAPTNNAYTDYTTGLINPNQLEGRVFWDDSDKALSYWTDVTGTAIQTGQEVVFRCTNNSGATITNGSVIYFNGNVTGGIPNVELAQADTYNKCKSIGVATTDIPNTGSGFATKYGKVRDVDTSSFNVGDQVFLSPTVEGAFTNIRPIDPNYAVQVGTIITSHATTGVLFAIAQRGAIIKKDVTGLDYCECIQTITRLSTSQYRVDNVDYSDRLGMVLKINTNDRPTNVITNIDTTTSVGDSIVTIAGEPIPSTLNFIRYNLDNNKQTTITANYWYTSFNSTSTDVLNLPINRNKIVYSGGKGRIVQAIVYCSDVGTNTNGATFNLNVNGGSNVLTSNVSLITGNATSTILINSTNNEVVSGDEIIISNDIGSGNDDIDDGYVKIIIAKN